MRICLLNQVQVVVKENENDIVLMLAFGILVICSGFIMVIGTSTSAYVCSYCILVVFGG